MMKPALSERVIVRLDADVRAVVARAAEEERRSISNMVRCVLSDWAHGRGNQSIAREGA